MEQKQAFNIVATKEAFDTLSSRLYSNPVLAVIRELSSNAYDAQKDAGVEKPFDIHIPTFNEPFFRIRDYGNGLSEDFISEIYTTFFMSTKTYNANQIGAFGLGSKSPFSLVDKFNVISYYDGKKYTYEMSKEDGLPAVTKISEENSNEPTGLEIYFEDSKTDYYLWKENAYNFFSRSIFLPNINLNFNSDSFARERLIYTKDTIVSGSYFDGVYVSIAGVCFPVKMSELHNSDLSDRLDKSGIKIVCITAKKDDVSVTPSREEIHYNQKTVEFLNRRILEVIEKKFQWYRDNFANLSISEKHFLFEQRWAEDLKQRVIDEQHNLFEKMFFCSENYRGKFSISMHSEILQDNRIAFLDFSGIANTTKKKVIENVLNGTTVDGSKITSSAFTDVLKNIKRHFSDINVFILPKKGVDITSFIKNEEDSEIPTIRWKDYVDVEKKPKRKMGFKLKGMRYAENGHWYLFDYYGESLELGENEIGLLVKDRKDYYDGVEAKILNKVFPNKKVFLRICPTDNTYNIWKNKGYKDWWEIFRKVFEKNKNRLLEEKRIWDNHQLVSDALLYRVPEDHSLLNFIKDEKYLPLKGEGYYETLNYFVDTIDVPLPDDGDRFLIRNFANSENEFVVDKEKESKKFPLLNYIELNSYQDDSIEKIKALFDYMLLCLKN